MLDLIKTFILGILIDKKIRYIFIFIFLSFLYRFIKWLLVVSLYEMSPVSFSKVNNDGSLSFIFLKRYEQTIYPEKYQLPTRYGKRVKEFDVKMPYKTKDCEANFFKIYENLVVNFFRNNKDVFTIDFVSKFPRNIGDISYDDGKHNIVKIYEKLKKEGVIFNRNEKINYCDELKKYNKR